MQDLSPPHFSIIVEHIMFLSFVEIGHNRFVISLITRNSFIKNLHFELSFPLLCLLTLILYFGENIFTYLFEEQAHIWIIFICTQFLKCEWMEGTLYNFFLKNWHSEKSKRITAIVPVSLCLYFYSLALCIICYQWHYMLYNINYYIPLILSAIHAADFQEYHYIFLNLGNYYQHMLCFVWFCQL